MKTHTATADNANYQHAGKDDRNVVPRLYPKLRISRDAIDDSPACRAVPHAIAQLSSTIRTIHTSPTTIDVPIEATVNRQSKSKLRNNQIKPTSRKSLLWDKGPFQPSTIQPSSIALLHPSKTRRPLSYRRPGAGLPPKSFRRTEELPPHVVRSGSSDMSEDDLGGNPAPGR